MHKWAIAAALITGFTFKYITYVEQPDRAILMLASAALVYLGFIAHKIVKPA